MINDCPPLRGVTPRTIEGVLKLVDAGSVVDGPIGVYDVLERVFLVVVVKHGMIVAWQLSSCPTREAADAEQRRLVAAVELINHSATDRGEEVIDSMRRALLKQQKS